jgi:branched-chain amino acid transport system permease protein
MTSIALLDRRRLLGLLMVALVILVAPLALSKGFFLSLLCRIGIMTIFALSYNMLLGQTGLLSFGHAVYYGLGAFATLHMLNGMAKVSVHLPVTLLPLLGGAAGLLFGVVFGYVTTRRAGTTFAMISLGIGEMVAASSLMFPAFFGGEGGISGNRVTGKGWFGINYGTQLQMYYLIAFWAVLCAAAIYALTRTPLGRLANAVRDNPERVQFIGYNPQWIRYLMVVLAGFFAGVAGGLSGLQYEIVTAEALSDHTSGIVILMAFVGGIGSFYGPVIGAVLVTVLQVAVAGVTPAWPLYFGLFFLLIVLYAPGGIAGILVEHRAVWRAGLLRTLAPAYLLAALPATMLACGIIAMVEMAYALVNGPQRGTTRLQILFLPLDGATVASWVFALATVGLGLFLLSRAWRSVAQQWQQVHAALQSRGTLRVGAAVPSEVR